MQSEAELQHELRSMSRSSWSLGCCFAKNDAKKIEVKYILCKKDGKS